MFPSLWRFSRMTWWASPISVNGNTRGHVASRPTTSTAHPEQARTLVAHEPPVVDLLPDSARVRARIQDIYDTYRAEGAEQAMAKFLPHTGLGQPPGQADAPRWQPSAEQLAREAAHKRLAGGGLRGRLVLVP
jgi:hypothetical protein